jgi:hypothetical protein
MVRLWNLPPGSRPYLTTDNTQRGLAYNPVNNHLLLVSRAPTNSIRVLDADTGADLWTMNVDTNIVLLPPSGGTFSLNMVEVTEDGAVYACNLTQAGDLRVYRWESDSAPAVPTLAWQGNPGPADVVRWGDSIDLRGSDVNPELVVTARNTNYVSILSPAFGSGVKKYGLVAGVNAGDLGLGVTFGANSSSGNPTIWAKAVLAPLRRIELADAGDVLAPSVLQSITNYPGIGPLGYDSRSNVLAGLGIETPDNVRLLDATTGANIDTEFFPTDNANANGTGAAAFAPGRVYVLDSNNGIVAYSFSRPNCAAPGSLHLARSGSNVVLTWDSPGYRLQYATEIANPPSATVWTDLLEPSPSTQALDGNRKFFRLVCP